jgi:hypothetical protein
VRPKENVAYLVPTNRSYIPFKMAALDFPETEATYERLPYMFVAGVNRVISGSAVSSSASGYEYDYVVSPTGGNTLGVYTIEAGDNNAVHEMEYSFPTQISMKWAAKDALKVSSKWNGRQRTATTFTSINLVTVEEILVPKIYIHDTTLGSGQIQGTLIGYELTYDTGIFPLATGDGELFYHTLIQKEPALTLRLTYEHDANATAEYLKAEAQTDRMVRILHEGSSIGAGGTFSKKTYRFDMCGKYTAFPPYGETDGDNTITAELKAGYNGTLFAEFLVVNLLSALV